MKRNSYFHYLLIAALAAVSGYDASAAVRRPNRADSRGTANSMVAASQYVDDMYYSDLPEQTALPVRVANSAMADAISSGGTFNGIGVSNLESCARIYPDGEFAWTRPTAGARAGGAMTCAALVELRSTEPVSAGTEKNVLLASAYVAAGDTIKCNISDFPEYSYTANADESVFTFPRDAEPTHQDVINVMNDEQKQNAGLKIAALAVAGAIGGNVVGKNEPGQDTLFGTGKRKMQSTAIGALGGAALGAGSVYTGKVAGDMILSAGVNAAAGAVVGNVIATGNEVLRIEDCVINNVRTTCLYGRIVPTTSLVSDREYAFYDIGSAKTWLCTEYSGGEYKSCTDTELLSIKLDAYPDTLIDQIDDRHLSKVTGDAANQYHLETVDGRTVIKPGGSSDSILAKISAAGKPNNQRVEAMIADVNDTMFGIKQSDWAKKKSEYATKKIWGRNGDGSAYDIGQAYQISDFYPMYRSASDGGVVDFSNKARMKFTLIGAGAGGALGAFTAYQGAQSDIESRWVEAVTEYKDSLQKVYCVTGKRFLSFYNDAVTIPAPQQ